MSEHEMDLAKWTPNTPQPQSLRGLEWAAAAFMLLLTVAALWAVGWALSWLL